MKNRFTNFRPQVCIFILTIFFIMFACEKYPLDSKYDFEEFLGPYFGEPYPDTIAERFCPDFFIENLHTPPIFSPDMKEVYFKPSSTVGHPKIFEMKLGDEYWSEPFHASFNFNSLNDAPFITRDGERLYFLSDEGSSYVNFKENIYYVSRVGDDWSKPKKLSEHINDFDLHWQFSLADNYNLYFQDADMDEIYVSKYINGEYQIAEKLPDQINSTLLSNGSPFIAHDESYLIFEQREGGYSDLYISYRKDDDSWSDPINLGPAVNTDGDEIYAYVTADDGFLFFLRRTNDGSFPYWMDAKIIEFLRPTE